MISRTGQKTRTGPSDPFGTSGASPLFRLSATMVELSLRHQLPDLGTEVPAKAPMKPDCDPPAATGPFVSGHVTGVIEVEESKAGQPSHYESGPTRRELLRASISRISDQSVKTLAWLRTRPRIAALALLVLPLVYAFHHQVKSQSQTPAMLQQRQGPIVPSNVSQDIHNHAQTVAPRKVKSRRHQSDYIAKDTYTYYGKDGKPTR